MSFREQNARRKIVVVLLRLEGIAILALGAYLIAKGLLSSESTEWFVISGIIFMIGIAGFGLLIAAIGFKNSKNYGRGPSVLANLIAIGVSKYIFEAGYWWLAFPLTIYAATTIFLTITLIPKEN